MPKKTVDRKIQRFNRGAKKISTAHMNSIVDGINRTLVGVDAPSPSSNGSGGAAPSLKLTLVSVSNDYLTCTDSGGNTVYAAKPYELRSTPFDGNTIGGVTYTTLTASTRSATDGTDTETQEIVPAYVVGAEIIGQKPKAGTGVTTDASPQAPIAYLEINQGRAWAYTEPEPAQNFLLMGA